MDPDAIAMARFLIREHDTAAAAAYRARNMPNMAAEATGALRGIDMALAWLGGRFGYRSVETFIRDIRGGVTDLRPIPEGEARTMDGNR